MENQEPAPETGRACLHCGDAMPLGKNPHAKWCSSKCSSAASYRRNREDVLKRTGEYQKENREQSRRYARKHYHKDPDKAAVRFKSFRLSDYRATMLRAAKQRAKMQGLPFNLVPEDIHLPDFCPALGIPLAIGNGGATDASPSLDKIIPALGYTRGNVVVISNRANRAKSNLAVHELRALADFYENLISTGWMQTRKETPP